MTLAPWFDRFDALTYTRDKARQYANLAGKQLEDLPANLASQTLAALPEFVVSRSH